MKRTMSRYLALFQAEYRRRGSPPIVAIPYAEPEDRCPDRPEAYCFRFVKNGGERSYFFILLRATILDWSTGCPNIAGKHLVRRSVPVPGGPASRTAKQRRDSRERLHRR